MNINKLIRLIRAEFAKDGIVQVQFTIEKIGAKTKYIVKGNIIKNETE